jgi:hypothetical protein
MSRMQKLVSTVGVMALMVAMLTAPAARAQSEGDVRLADGNTPAEGRVEVFHEGVWGTVCDDLWGIDDASVVCRQLGFIRAEAATNSATFGPGQDPIWMDNVNCSGDEERLVDCPFNGFGSHDCSHSEDAGAICAGTPAPAMGAAALTLAALGLIASGTWRSGAARARPEPDSKAPCRLLGAQCNLKLSLR